MLKKKKSRSGQRCLKIKALTKQIYKVFETELWLFKQSGKALNYL